uniref:Caspase-3-like n=1 Tax=Mesocestoides corti TaxID=53468 RepID=A0A5K3FQ28_MESCO
MARLLCSYGARPRQSHNSQGQTPLVLSKYVLRNSKMTKLLSSFSPTSSPQSKRSTVSTSEDIDAIQNTEEDAVILPVLPESSLNLTAKSSTVDSGAIATRLRRTGVVAAMATKVAALSPRNDAIETMSTSSLPLSSVVDNETIGVSPRPYLHREAKVAFTEVDLAVDPDTLEPPRPRANSLKVCRRELEVLRRKLPAFLTRSSLQKAMVHQPRPVPLRARRKASTMDPSEYYPMASPKRGICVIINNMTYWHPQFRNRGGCDKDEKRVEKVFGDLGFLVKVLRNLSSGEMRSELKFIGRKTDHTAYDCFVAVVMAHGGLGELYGVNGDAFPVHQLTFDFTAEKCPSLAGKPKLFFIQACRGDEYQLGYALPVQSNAEEPPQVVTNPPRVESASNPLYISSGKDDEPAIAAAKLPRKQRLVPSFADFLLSYATLAGFKAQRDAKQGSMYIQTLCHHLEVYGRVRSLLDIVTSVHREVSERVFREADSPEDEGTIFQQTPEVRHTLTRRVQFV